MSSQKKDRFPVSSQTAKLMVWRRRRRRPFWKKKTCQRMLPLLPFKTKMLSALLDLFVYPTNVHKFSFIVKKSTYLQFCEMLLGTLLSTWNGINHRFFFTWRETKNRKRDGEGGTFLISLFLREFFSLSLFSHVATALISLGTPTPFAKKKTFQTFWRQKIGWGWRKRRRALFLLKKKWTQVFVFFSFPKREKKV